MTPKDIFREPRLQNSLLTNLYDIVVSRYGLGHSFIVNLWDFSVSPQQAPQFDVVFMMTIQIVWDKWFVQITNRMHEQYNTDVSSSKLH